MIDHQRGNTCHQEAMARKPPRSGRKMAEVPILPRRAALAERRRSGWFRVNQDEASYSQQRGAKSRSPKGNPQQAGSTGPSCFLTAVRPWHKSASGPLPTLQVKHRVLWNQVNVAQRGD